MVEEWIAVIIVVKCNLWRLSFFLRIFSILKDSFTTKKGTDYVDDVQRKLTFY